MKVFSKILLESKNDVFILTSDELNRYKEAISKTKRLVAQAKTVIKEKEIEVKNA